MRQVLHVALCHALIATAFALAPGTVHAQQDTRPLELSATGWELVEVLSMDDSRFAPAASDKGRYTIKFQEDGGVAIEAGCNRGKSSLEMLQPPRLKFEAIAVTRALCPPPSVSGRFLDQLPWVRSYVTRDGHLFLATAADGSILEFRPLSGEAVSARVLGISLISDSVDTLREVSLARVLDDFAQQHDLRATEEEIAIFVGKLEAAQATEASPGEPALTVEEQAEVQLLRRTMAESMIRAWKVNAALHKEYGGRIIYQQFGAEPLDAYARLLRKYEQAGEFALLRPNLQAPFWDYFADETRHQVMPAGSEDAQRAFATPPWEQPTQ
jgi:heat shock protein HslJ